MTDNEFEQKLESIHKECFHWSLSLCHYDEPLAEEVLQDAYLKAFKNKESFNGKASFKTWVFTIIKNASIDYFRKVNRRAELNEVAFKDVKVAKTATQEKRYRAKGDEAAVKHIVQNLSAREQEVVELIMYQDLSVTEAAEVMDVSRASVNSYLKRAKTNLKDIILKERQRPSGPSFEKSYTYNISDIQKKVG